MSANESIDKEKVMDLADKLRTKIRSIHSDTRNFKRGKVIGLGLSKGQKDQLRNRSKNKLQEVRSLIDELESELEKGK